MPKLGIHLHGKLFRDTTRIAISYTKSDEYNEDWLTRTNVGRYPMVIIIISVLVFTLILTTYKYLIEKFRPKRLLADLAISMPLHTRLLSNDLSQLNGYYDDNSLLNSEAMRDTSTNMNINKTLRASKDMTPDIGSTRSQILQSE